MAEDNGSVSTGNSESTESTSTETTSTESTSTSSESTSSESTTTDHWTTTLDNDDIRGWAESKGLNKAEPKDLAQSYYNLEKLFGADKAGRTVTMLGDDASEADRAVFFDKLGRPAEPEGYGLKPVEGQSEDFAKWASSSFHEIGLTSKQGEQLAAKWEEFVGEAQTSQATNLESNRLEAEATLKKDWGTAYDQKVAGIDAAAKVLGLTEEHLTGLKSTMGSVEAMKFVDSLNSKLGEDTMLKGDPIHPDAMTPVAAKAQMDALMGDKEFLDAWGNKTHPGHAAAVEKKARLSRMMAGEAP